MTKQELMETYTVEQLADKYLRLQERFNRYTEVIKGVVNELPEELKQGTEFHLKIDRLQSEAEKYRKAFENAKKERDCQIVEYQKKMEELTAERDFIAENSISTHQDPIDIAKDLINAEGEYEHNPLAKAFCRTNKGTYRIFDIGELRQIAEHLLIYCNHNGEVEE